MPLARYIRVLIAGEQVDLKSAEELPASISYKLEDIENFQSKKSSEVLNLTIPATTTNDKIANTFHNPGFDDLTPNQQKRSFQPAVIEANGYELFVGKSLLKSASHDSLPIDYEFDLYGNNGDWIIPLKESTLYDFLKHITFTFDKATIEASWAFDGTDELLPYLFAPVRYGQPFETIDGKEDFNMLPVYMRPSLSVYWLLYWGFKSQGYKIAPGFVDTTWFRKLTMPWTWGNFLFAEGSSLDSLDFLIKTNNIGAFLFNEDYNDYIDVNATNETTNGAFDNQGVYDYDAGTFAMNWTYIPGLGYGTLEAAFHVQLLAHARVTDNSTVEIRIHWFKNNVVFKETIALTLNAPVVGKREFHGLLDDFQSAIVDENDVITVKIFVHSFDTALGGLELTLLVEEFGLEYFRIPLGGTINFEKISSLKKYKWIDFLAGILDSFNISPQTDPINKVVTLEPMHPYSLEFDQSVKQGGYFNGNHLDWESKQDISKQSKLSLFSDSERELRFRFKEDASDGLVKTVQDRHGITLAAGKYVFNDRFKAGLKEYENRFFSTVIHYRLDQWGFIGNVPQMICIVPENISQTSREESQNTFLPKLTYYKGIGDFGWVFDGEERTDYPFMFAVNYLSNGANDPILSYCDEFCVHPDDGLVPSPGLLKRFFLQRLAIMRNGQYYETNFKLNNIDVTNWLHREHIALRGQKWELVELKDYKPLLEQTTESVLRKHSPITQADNDSVFPSYDAVATQGITPTAAFDTKYNQLLCLFSDILSSIK